MEKVSVIVPMYNVERYVERCLESLLNQSYSPIEIIAVSDVSPDRSAAVASRLAANCGGGKTLVVKELSENVGVGKVRDVGIEMASGKYIMFVDADDFIHPKTVELSVRSMEAHQAQMVEFGFSRVSNGDACCRQVGSPEVDVIEGGMVIEQRSDHIACNKMYLRSLIEKNRLRFVHRCFEDTAFTRNYSLMCDKAVFLKEYLYYYYINPQSLTSTLTIDKLKMSIERAQDVIGVYLEHGLVERAEQYRLSSRKFLIRHLMNVAKDAWLELDASIKVKDDTRWIIDLFNRHRTLFDIYGCYRLGAKFTVKHILKKIGLMK